jgi:hypothetical protein
MARKPSSSASALASRRLLGPRHRAGRRVSQHPHRPLRGSRTPPPGILGPQADRARAAEGSRPPCPRCEIAVASASPEPPGPTSRSTRRSTAAARHVTDVRPPPSPHRAGGSPWNPRSWRVSPRNWARSPEIARALESPNSRVALGGARQPARRDSDSDVQRLCCICREAPDEPARLPA